MAKSIIQILLLFGILFTFSCCNQPQEPNDNLHLTVAWEKDIHTTGKAIDYENEIMFFNVLGDDSEYISALNLENGEILLETEDTGYNDVPPVFDDSNVYIMHGTLNKRKISVIDRKDGKIKKQTDVPGANTRMCLWTLYNDTLYWGGRDSHFMYAFSTTGEDGVRTIWGSEDVTSDIMGDIVPYNDRLYFVSSVFPYPNEPEPSFLISMKPDGSDIKQLEIPADFWYTDAHNTQFYKDKLYLAGLYLICVNPETMKIEWKLKTSDKYEFLTCRDFTIDNDRIYAVIQDSSKDGLLCVNAKNGKVIWKERIDTSFYGSILYTPIIHEGYIYQPAQACIIVFNAENGKYVGRDEGIRTGILAAGITEQYKDLMIFSGTCGKIYALKMDMHTR